MYPNTLSMAVAERVQITEDVPYLKETKLTLVQVLKEVATRILKHIFKLFRGRIHLINVQRVDRWRTMTE